MKSKEKPYEMIGQPCKIVRKLNEIVGKPYDIVGQHMDKSSQQIIRAMQEHYKDKHMTIVGQSFEKQNNIVHHIKSSEIIVTS